MTLTQSQRAKRHALKINRRVKNDLPLFAGTGAISQFLTDEDEQLKRVKRWDEICQRYMDALADCDLQMLKQAEEIREKLSPGKRTELDQRLARLQEKWHAYTQPEYILDYWRTES